MASISTNKYYSIDGVELSVYPTSETVAENIVSKSYNTITGKFVEKLVCRKMKVNWVFEYADYNKVSDIYNLIVNKVNSGSRTFTITYYDPRGDFYSMDAYLGTPTTFDSKSSKDKGLIKIWKLELHFIEIQGDLLI